MRYHSSFWGLYMRILVVLCLLSVRCWAQIVQAHSLNDVMEHFKDSDQSTFAVFDIDMVLIQPDDPAFQMANIEMYYPVAKRIILSVPPEKRDILYTLTSLYFKSVLVDEKTPDFFRDLNRKGVASFGLTASLTGSLLHIPNLEAWKCDHLRCQGIYFENEAPCCESIVFCDLPPYRGNYPTFFGGVLFTNGGLNSKGKVLVTFLKDAHLCPKQIIFADDKEDNVKSVEQALLEYNPSIKFVGLHYLGARYYPSQPLSEEEFAKRWEKLAAEAIELE